MVKWSCISGGARAQFCERPPSEKAADWSLTTDPSFLFLFFARFPLEGATFRDLCSPMGLSRLHEGLESAFDLQKPGYPNRKQDMRASISVIAFLGNAKQKVIWLRQSSSLPLLRFRKAYLQSMSSIFVWSLTDTTGLKKRSIQGR